jgi:molybdate transport system ATP-binding protein
MSIEVAIKKRLKGFTLDIDFTADNTRVGLLGASGCGKSMTLKCIAGIEKPDSGHIIINGRTVFDSGRHINVKPRERGCGFLFQNYALFPNMTIAENIGIVLHKIPKDERLKRTREILSRFEIISIADRKPAELSGGQQQRAALARMMVLAPEIIMLDEPFSALDFFLKQQIETNVVQLLSDFKGTLLFVSHNRDEVYRICDAIRIISDGTICRSGTCADIFADPENVTAARLTGCKNIASFSRTGNRTIFVRDWGLELSVHKDIPAAATHVGIRAHYIRPPLPGETENCFDFTIRSFRNSPFSVSEYLETTETNVPLDREISVDTGNVLRHPDYEMVQRQRLCIPADELIFLSD